LHTRTRQKVNARNIEARRSNNANKQHDIAQASGTNRRLFHNKTKQTKQ